MLITGKALEKVRGFDERFFMYVEDIDICTRILKTEIGFKVCYYPYTIIGHQLAGSSSRAGLKEKIKLYFEWQKSLRLFFKIHKSRVEYLFFILIQSLGIIIRMFLWVCKRKVF